jgi:hypothetical protein
MKIRLKQELPKKNIHQNEVHSSFSGKNLRVTEFFFFGNVGSVSTPPKNSYC